VDMTYTYAAHNMGQLVNLNLF